jgi:hypothetical protein
MIDHAGKSSIKKCSMDDTDFDRSFSTSESTESVAGSLRSHDIPRRKSLVKGGEALSRRGGREGRPLASFPLLGSPSPYLWNALFVAHGHGGTTFFPFSRSQTRHRPFTRSFIPFAVVKRSNPTAPPMRVCDTTLPAFMCCPGDGPLPLQPASHYPRGKACHGYVVL